MHERSAISVGVCTAALGLALLAMWAERKVYASDDANDGDHAVTAKNVQKMISEGQRTFRFDTFGDQAFWGDALKLHEAVEGTKFGGVGPGLSPRTALALGLKVDATALQGNLVQQIQAGHVNLDDPAVT